MRAGYGLDPVPWGNVPFEERTPVNLDNNYGTESLKKYKNNVYRAGLLSEWRKRG